MNSKKYIGLIAFMLSSCSSLPSVGPDYSVPSIELPSSWSAHTQTDSQLRTQLHGHQHQQVSEEQLQTWWEIFSDKNLSSLVEQALSQNLEIEQARARLAEAIARRGLSTAPFYPTLDLNLDKTRADPGAGSSRVLLNRGLITEYQVGLSTGWELDLFGGTRRALEAAVAEVQSNEAANKAIRLKIIADVCEVYFQLRNSERRVQIAESNANIQKQNLDLVRSRFEAGLTDELDVAQAESQLATTRSLIPLFKADLARNQQSLFVLLGKEPKDLGEPLVEGMFSTPPYAIPVLGLSIISGESVLTLPAQVLRQRPDVIQFERSLAAATARKGEALADYFPSIRIGAALGYRSSKTSDLFESDRQLWQIGPSINWPILTGGRVSAGVDIREAQIEAALAAYKESIISALTETETAFAELRFEALRTKQLQIAFLASDKALALAREQYSQGLVDFQRVLESERLRFQSEDGVVQAQTRQLVSFIRLMKALGYAGKPE